MVKSKDKLDHKVMIAKKSEFCVQYDHETFDATFC